MSQKCVQCGKEMQDGEAELCTAECADTYWAQLAERVKRWPLTIDEMRVTEQTEQKHE